MANYTCTVRTNYFRVKDPDEFRSFMARVYGREDAVTLWEEKSENGTPLFAFGSYGGIGGLRGSAENESEDEVQDDDEAYDEFIAGLQHHIADDDAVIILEAGHEKMRYVIGCAEIVTSEAHEGLDMTSLVISKAAAMLNDPKWITKCEY